MLMSSKGNQCFIEAIYQSPLIYIRISQDNEARKGSSSDILLMLLLRLKSVIYHQKQHHHRHHSVVAVVTYHTTEPSIQGPGTPSHQDVKARTYCWVQSFLVMSARKFTQLLDGPGPIIF